MSYLALYREWRPKTFDEVVEQKQAVYALRQAVIKGKIGHAYLFSGTRGTGKTTLAKIFSRAINCLDPIDGNPCNSCQVCRGILDGSLMDVVEMDAASNNSVDNIRRICDEVVFMPSLAKYKVYIVDEVHMLSTGAFNALLKTLEEPPAHAVFILATTEPHRLPATILSRCQRYEFRRIPLDSIAVRLKEIAKADDIDLSDQALEAIATFADGAMRDAISLLDQARASIAGRIERDDVMLLAGITQDSFMTEIATAILKGKVDIVITSINELVMSGRDLSRFITDLAQYYRNLLICQISREPQKLIQTTDSVIEDMISLSKQISHQTIIKLIQALSELMSDLRWSSDPRTFLEVGLIRIMSEFISNDNVSTKCESYQSSTEKTGITTQPKSIPVVPEKVQSPQEDIPDLIMEEPPVVQQDMQPPQEDIPDLIMEEPPVVQSEFDLKEFWNKVLDHVQLQGQMVMYLFGKAASVRLCQNEFQVIFGKNDTAHYKEFSKDQSQKILSKAIRDISGTEMKLKIRSEEDPEKASNEGCVNAEEPWIRKARETAEQFGIPIKMEE